MENLDHFFERVDRLSQALKISEATLSTRLLGSGQGISRLRSGRDIGVRRLMRAFEDLQKLEASTLSPEGVSLSPTEGEKALGRSVVENEVAL